MQRCDNTLSVILNEVLEKIKDMKEKTVRKRGLEPLRPHGHYPLKVACIPISPLPQREVQNYIEKIKNANFFKKILFGFRLWPSMHNNILYLSSEFSLKRQKLRPLLRRKDILQ